MNIPIREARARIDDSTVLRSSIPYPATPVPLEPHQEDLYFNLLKARAPEDWVSPFELYQVAQIAILIGDVQMLQEDLDSNGYKMFNPNSGKDEFNPSMKARNDNMRIILSMAARMGLTITSLPRGGDKDTAIKRAKAHQQALEGEKQIHQHSAFDLLAAPSQDLDEE